MPTAEELRAYARRRWDLVAAEKLRHGAERYRRGGPQAALAAARHLAERWSELHPEGPTPASRQADFEHHVALKVKLDRTRHVLAGR
ncbi:MAG: hypothetical protein KF718_27200 [Polyangiaceae bacterium]|nr:hypothetical protein [Polyangiaceae bacterium]